MSITAPGHSGSLLPPDSEQEEEEKKKRELEEDDLNKRLTEESSAFYSSGRLWDDGVIMPQDTRKVKKQKHTDTVTKRLITIYHSTLHESVCLQVLGDCLDIIKQQHYQLSTEKPRSTLLRM